MRDGGPFLHEAVASILAQSFSSLELLVVDDGSRDGALERLDSSDPRIQVTSSRGRGVSAAFNTGLALARGEFIARMDADDLALERRLEWQLEYLSQHPEISICGTCVELFSDQPLQGGNLRYQEWLNACRSPQRIRTELFVESPIPNPTVMFRRQALSELGGYADPDWPEDYDLFLRADRAGMKMGKPQPVLLRWRDHDRRLTRSSERYAISRFQRAKAHYLAWQIRRGRFDQTGRVTLWGAGPGGRLFYDLLDDEEIRVDRFIDVHPRRIGGTKRGRPVVSMDELGTPGDQLLVVAVGAAGARAEIRAHLDGQGWSEGHNYLFVA